MSYRSAITGKFVSKEFAEANPDTTVKMTHVNLKQELLEFLQWCEGRQAPGDEEEVDKYLEEREK